HGTLTGFAPMGTTSNWLEGRTNMTTCAIPLCTGTPTPGNTTGPASICSDIPFTLGLQDISLRPGITYQWESSADGSTWANAAGAGNTATYTTTHPASTWSRAHVPCAANGPPARTPSRVGMGGARAGPPAPAQRRPARWASAVQTPATGTPCVSMA